MVLSPEGNVWFAKALVTYRLQCWEQLHKDITKNLDADPEGKVGDKLAAQWRDLISDTCMGAQKDFFFGITLLMDTAKAKVDLNDKTKIKASSKIKDKKEIVQYAKILLDPMALSWIERALKKH